jgi:hypothetical protein
VRVEIESILNDPRGVATEGRAAAARSLWKRAIVPTAGLLIGGAIAAVGAWLLKPPPANAVTRFTVSTPSFSNVGRQVLDIAPDGTQLVYGSGNILYLRPMDELDAFSIAIPNIPRIINPVFSPDGRSIAFFAFEEMLLKRVPVSGGAAVSLCPAENPFGMSWEEDERILFGQGTAGILQCPANGGKPDVLIAAEAGERLHGPHLLPGGKAVLFTSLAGSGGGWDQAKIFAKPVLSGERKLLIDGGADARYLPTGHLIYFLAGNLLVVPFDVEKLEKTGRPIPVVEGVRFANQDLTGTAQFSVSRTGTLIYQPGPLDVTPVSGNTSVTIVDTVGAGAPLPLPGNPYVSVRVSPDGKQLALGTDDGKNANIWVWDLSGKSLALIGNPWRDK